MSAPSLFQPSLFEPLLEAVGNNDLDLVRTLVARGAPLEYPYLMPLPDGSLIALGEAKTPEMIDLLIELGANINAALSRDFPNTLLRRHMASKNELSKRLALHIINTTNVVRTHPERAGNLIDDALSHRVSPDIILALAEHGAWIGTNTLMIDALQQYDGDVVDILIEGGGDVNARVPRMYVYHRNAFPDDEPTILEYVLFQHSVGDIRIRNPTAIAPILRRNLARGENERRLLRKYLDSLSKEDKEAIRHFMGNKASERRSHAVRAWYAPRAEEWRAAAAGNTKNNKNGPVGGSGGQAASNARKGGRRTRRYRKARRSVKNRRR